MLERSDSSGRDAVSVRHRVPALSFSREWVEEQEEGRRRKQEKGTVSRQVPSVCLHIVFLGDMALVPRDMFARNGGNLIFLARNHEIYGHDGDRKSTRLTPVTNEHLVCRLLLEKQNKKHS